MTKFDQKDDGESKPYITILSKPKSTLVTARRLSNLEKLCFIEYVGLVKCITIFPWPSCSDLKILSNKLDETFSVCNDLLLNMSCISYNI